MRYVSERHFSEGIWAADGPLRLASYTCLGCGHRATTWDAFREHRSGCTGLPRFARTPAVSAADREALEDLLGEAA